MGAFDGHYVGYRSGGNKIAAEAAECADKERTRAKASVQPIQYAEYVAGDLETQTDPYVMIDGVHYTLLQAHELATEILSIVKVETVTKYKLDIKQEK